MNIFLEKVDDEVLNETYYKKKFEEEFKKK
jgi:hypothetical protein